MIEKKIKFVPRQEDRDSDVVEVEWPRVVVDEDDKDSWSVKAIINGCDQFLAAWHPGGGLALIILGRYVCDDLGIPHGSCFPGFEKLANQAPAPKAVGLSEEEIETVVISAEAAAREHGYRAPLSQEYGIPGPIRTAIREALASFAYDAPERVITRAEFEKAVAAYKKDADSGLIASRLDAAFRAIGFTIQEDK